MKLWSSQLWTQFLKLRKEAWKFQDFDAVWTRALAIPVWRSNQLSYEATDIGSWSFVGSHVPVRNESTMKWYMKWIIYMKCDEKFRTLISYPQFIYMIHFIYHFIVDSFHTGTHKWPAPNVSGFIAQLVRASHRYREVTGSNPVENLNFSGFLTQLQELRS